MNEQDSKNTEDLLAILKDLGVNPKSGRKQRSDKGKERGPNSTPRSDIGVSRKSIEKHQIDIYLSLRNKLLNKTVEKESEGVRKDINGIYLLIEHDNKQIHQYYEFVSHGSQVHRTVKHIQGKIVDLEQYRFRALQDIASPSKELSPQVIKVFKNEFEETNTNNTYDLFCKLYHIKDEDLIMWTYDKWKEHYNIVADDLLSDDFKFDLNKKPGSEDFYPEYADTLLLKEQLATAALEQSKEYINERARIYNEEYSKEFTKAKAYVLKDQCELSMAQVEKMARQLVDEDKINNIVKERLEKWLNDKKGE